MAARRSSPVFLDTSAIYALTDADDDAHAKCLRVYQRTPRFVCHTAVLLEVFSLISKRIHKRAAVVMLASLRASAKIEVVHVDPQLLAASWERAVRFADKEWDWIDCLSFELMEQRGLGRAHTLDHHFRQAGFQVI